MHLRLLLLPALADESELPAQARLFDLLSALHALGSVQHAAAQLNLSYRHAWGLLKAWERQLGQALLVSERGRGTALTPLGQRLVQTHTALQPLLQRTQTDCNRAVEQAMRSGVRAAPAGQLLAAGSFDPLLLALRDQALPAPWQLQVCSAIEALASLHEGRVQLAGFAMADVHRRGSLAHVLMRRWLRPGDTQLLRLATRAQGLVLSARVPVAKAARLHSLADLAALKLRIVNRQRSSSARWLLDALMTQAGLYAPDLPGYGDTCFSEDAAMEQLQAGGADAVLGTQALAAAHHLRFLPLTQETYWLAYRAHDHAAPWLQTLKHLLRSAAFRRLVHHFPGYDAQASGRTVSPKAGLPWYTG